MTDRDPAPEDGSDEWADEDLVTYCRIMMVGPPCPHPCGSCRSSGVTFGQLRSGQVRLPS